MAWPMLLFLNILDEFARKLWYYDRTNNTGLRGIMQTVMRGLPRR
jgi:hypothetical protein